MQTDHENFMAMAIEEARSGVRAGERPFGSVVVRDGEVVGRGRNLSNSTFDPTAHAETRAIRDAATNLKNVILSGCTLYSTCEPCFMCCGATLYARIDTLVIGVRHATLREVTQWFKNYVDGLFETSEYTAEGLVKLTGAKLEIVSGVLFDECAAMYREWEG